MSVDAVIYYYPTVLRNQSHVSGKLVRTRSTSLKPDCPWLGPLIDGMADGMRKTEIPVDTMLLLLLLLFVTPVMEHWLER